MTEVNETNDSPAQILCRSCGLCCTGHLFIWAKLRPSELDSAEALGMQVFRSDPSHRRFSQPCPLWQGQCTIYNTVHYPRVCRAYRCKLLKNLLDEVTSLPDALIVIRQTKQMISELELLLPVSTVTNFRERLVAHIENLQKLDKPQKTELDFRLKAEALLLLYEKAFEVKDFFDLPDDQ